jgi:hypothetical protein
MLFSAQFPESSVQRPDFSISVRVYDIVNTRVAHTRLWYRLTGYDCNRFRRPNGWGPHEWREDNRVPGSLMKCTQIWSLIRSKEYWENLTMKGDTSSSLKVASENKNINLCFLSMALGQTFSRQPFRHYSITTTCRHSLVPRFFFWRLHD